MRQKGLLIRFNKPALLVVVIWGLLFLGACGDGGKLPIENSRPIQTTTVKKVNLTTSTANTTPEPAHDLPAEKAAVGYLAPDFKGTDLEGTAFNLAALRGKAILLNFWAVYCEPCRQEAPELRQAFETNKDKLQVVGINLNDEPEEARGFLNEFGLRYPVIIDNTGDLVFKYRVRAKPTTYFINSKGVITAIQVGLLTPEILDKELAQIINP